MTPHRLPALVAVGLGLAALLGPVPTRGDEPAKPGQPAPSPAPTVTALDPVEAYRGGIVKVTGKGFDAAVAITVSVGEKAVAAPNGSDTGAAARKPVFDVPAVRVDDTTFTFAVPDATDLGPHLVWAEFRLKDTSTARLDVPVPSKDRRFRVLSSTPAKLKVTGIFPKVNYPAHSAYGFTVRGEGFSRVGPDNRLVSVTGGQIPVEWKDTRREFEATPPGGKVLGFVEDTRQLEFRGIPGDKHSGNLQFTVRVGEAESDPAAVTLSTVPNWAPWVGAVGVVAAVALLLFVLVARVQGARVAGQECGTVEKFLYDPETDTLSLSKFQLFVWTGVAVFGYAFLTIARSLIQGVFEFAPIPEGLPGILAVSVGTTAAAVGITAARGPKGSGSIMPTWGDMLTAGGIVSPERVQFFAWTILGALAFVFLVVTSDPGTIEKLPKIPEGFLVLMGVSSAGYLGGKLARKPGPVIDTVSAREGSLVVDVQGRNLSKDAGFRIDGVDLKVALPAAGGAAALPPDGRVRVEAVTPDEAAGQSEFALGLRLMFDYEGWLAERRKTEPNVPTAGEWAAKEHELTVINRDGQQAAWKFKIVPKPPARFDLSAPPNPVVANAPLNLTIAARRDDGRAAASYTGTVNVTSNDPAAANLGEYTFTPADNGTHAIPVTLPTGGRETVITVTDAANKVEARVTVTVG